MTYGESAFSASFLERCRNVFSQTFSSDSFNNRDNKREKIDTLPVVSAAIERPRYTSAESAKEEMYRSPPAVQVLLIRHLPYARSPKENSFNSEELKKIKREKDLYGPPLKQGVERSFEKYLSDKSFSLTDFDLLIHSSYVRTWQTASIFSRHFQIKKVLSRSSSDTYRAKDVFDEIKKSGAKSVVLVDHQPFLREFFEYSTNQTSRHFLDLDEGSMILLDFPQSFQPGSAKKSTFVLP